MYMGHDSFGSWHRNPEDRNLNLRDHEHLKPYVWIPFVCNNRFSDVSMYWLQSMNHHLHIFTGIMSQLYWKVCTLN
jgi:hypothetical protein